MDESLLSHKNTSLTATESTNTTNNKSTGDTVTF